MEKQIVLENRQVTYTLRKNRRARKMRLAVYPNGSVTLTIPFHLKESIAERFVRDKAEWLFEKLASCKQSEGNPAPRLSAADYHKHKDAARTLALARAKHFSAFYNLPFSKISIRNQKTRWGSCSKKGNLSFNYKILFLPAEARDYVIVHEICHLQEFNHSKQFWALVAKAVPDYAAIRRDLRKKGVLF